MVEHGLEHQGVEARASSRLLDLPAFDRLPHGRAQVSRGEDGAEWKAGHDGHAIEARVAGEPLDPEGVHLALANAVLPRLGTRLLGFRVPFARLGQHEAAARAQHSPGLTEGRPHVRHVMERIHHDRSLESPVRKGQGGHVGPHEPGRKARPGEAILPEPEQGGREVQRDGPQAQSQEQLAHPARSPAQVEHARAGRDVEVGRRRHEHVQQAQALGPVLRREGLAALPGEIAFARVALDLRRGAARRERTRRPGHPGGHRGGNGRP